MKNEIVNRPTETFRCLDPNCGLVFKCKAGPVACQVCHSKDIEWVNFLDWKFDELTNQWWKPDETT